VFIVSLPVLRVISCIRALVSNKIKARLCACGNELRGSGVETYSPTIGALSYVVAHQISIIDRMHRCTVDVTGAYLYQDYPDDAKPIFLTILENVIGGQWRIRPAAPNADGRRRSVNWMTLCVGT
jgi:hypothetical protein